MKEIDVKSHAFAIAWFAAAVGAAFLYANAPHDRGMAGSIIRHSRSNRVDAPFGAIADVAASSSEFPPVTAAPANRSGGTRISVPEPLLSRTAFEPSGLVWLDDLQRYLVVSDDTGHAREKHAPWLFTMDRAGTVDPDPLVVAGAQGFDDVESIARADDGELYLVSSQCPSDHGDRPLQRQLLFQARRDGRRLSILHSVPLWETVRRSLGDGDLSALGLAPAAAGSETALDIEGSAFRDGALYLGLKTPGSSTRAIVWRLQDIAALFATQTLAPGQLQLYATVDLGRGDDEAVGLSDLIFDRAGRLLLLSTVRTTHDSGRCGALSIVDRPTGGELRARCVMAFPGRSPEGIAEIEAGRFMIVFDEGKHAPLYQEVAVAAP